MPSVLTTTTAIGTAPGGSSRKEEAMSSCKERSGKNTKSWTPIVHLNVGFVVGVLFVLLTFLVFSQKAAISGLNVATTVAQPSIKGPGETFVTSGVQIQGSGGSAEKGTVVYNTKGGYSETCEVDGDVRINCSALSVFLVPTASSERHEWSILPYSRKTMPGIKNVTVAQLQGPAAAPACTVTYGVPAVIFALGGLTGNFWHDFSDVLVPLFVASRRYGGEVQFLITNMQPWWPEAYRTILRGLSKYDAVNLDGDEHVRCFPHVTVGLHQHNGLSIFPEWVPGGPLSTHDFTRFMREVYALPRDAPASLVREPEKRPRLLLVHRGHSRRIMNEQEVLRAAEAAGFEAVAVDFRRDVTVDEQARTANSFDVLLGVHGAGLTNLVFLPPGGVLVQVVPYGRMDVIATLEFGLPAKDMGLRYIDYEVRAEESTLLEMLGPEHPAIKDPDSVHRSGWDKMTEFYLDKQSVRINITRFAPTLAQAFDCLRQQ
ncbi:hypothetical protein SETIT_5G080700v2 [Setaria italica]|uniref:Glycosyltransferase 61 catalytic domain-containing protein n=2 Tax=Setaria italica TaxID=4555 RepID=A0A368R2L8_SETIT|nr:hypothetical protein SETIT_5G080700v2 [Setaria italica]